MGLAAAEVRLKLNDGIARSVCQAVRHGDQQQAHSLRDIGAGEELFRVLIFRRSDSLHDSRNVGGKFRLLERSFTDVLMRMCNLSPWFHCSDSLFVKKNIVFSAVQSSFLFLYITVNFILCYT